MSASSPSPSPSRSQSREPLASAGAGDWSVEDAVEHTKSAVGDSFSWVKNGILMLWGKTSRRIRATGGLIIFTVIVLSLWRPQRENLPDLPKVYFEYGESTSPFNKSKVALLIENRPNPILAPLMLHFMGVVPPDWRFRFMGSNESVAAINGSEAIRKQVEIGKLDLTYIPSNMSTKGQEMISRFLTNLWLYETVLQPAEWLLVFQTDSILCANSRQSIDDYLDYDWVGAPWSPNAKFGGNGGLSMRRVSSILQILRNQQRINDTEPEDVWLTERLGHRPGAKLANGTTELVFSGEMFSGEVEHVTDGKKGGEKVKKPADGGIDSTGSDGSDHVKGIDEWRDGFYEPLGYHTGGSGTTLHGGIWGTPEMRQHIWDYCPEVKMTFEMDAAEYVPGHCNDHWKRGEEPLIGGGGYGGFRFDENSVDDKGYPYLPANLVPW